jgi:hypothetical protein
MRGVTRKQQRANQHCWRCLDYENRLSALQWELAGREAELVALGVLPAYAKGSQ